MKREKNQISLINFLNSFASKSKILFDKSKLKPPLANIPISFLKNNSRLLSGLTGPILRLLQSFKADTKSGSI